MSTQMIIRIDDEVKNRLNKLARIEGKTTSEMVMELIEERIKERDIGAYIDDLWNRIGMKDESDIEELLSLFSKGFNLLFTTKTPNTISPLNKPKYCKTV